MVIRAKKPLDGDEWVRCGNCSHKLFRLTNKLYKNKTTETLEIKCSSCKALNRW